MEKTRYQAPLIPGQSTNLVFASCSPYELVRGKEDALHEEWKSMFACLHKLCYRLLRAAHDPFSYQA